MPLQTTRHVVSQALIAAAALVTCARLGFAQSILQSTVNEAMHGFNVLTASMTDAGGMALFPRTPCEPFGEACVPIAYIASRVDEYEQVQSAQLYATQYQAGSYFAASAGVSAGIGSAQIGVQTSMYQSHTIKNSKESAMFYARNTASVVQLRQNQALHPNLSAPFWQMLQQCDEQQDFGPMLSMFGTHYLKSVNLGGVLTCSVTADLQSTSTLFSDGSASSLQASFANVAKAKTGFEQSDDSSTVDQQLASMSQVLALGGDKQLNGMVWVDSVNTSNAAALLNMELASLSSLLDVAIIPAGLELPVQRFQAYYTQVMSVTGCTDPNAKTFNPAAVVPDWSACVYNTVQGYSGCTSHSDCTAGSGSVNDDHHHEVVTCECNAVSLPGISHKQYMGYPLRVDMVAPFTGYYCFHMNFTTGQLWHASSWDLSMAVGQNQAFDLKQYSHDSCDDDDAPCSYEAGWCWLRTIPAGTEMTITQTRNSYCALWDDCTFTISGLEMSYSLMPSQDDETGAHSVTQMPQVHQAASPALRGAA